MEREELLKKYGWTIECESPFEISTNDGSFARGEAAIHVLANIQEQENDEQPIKYLYNSESFDDLNDKYQNSIREKKYLKEMGDEGWELVSVVYTAPSKVYNNITYYWKQKK